MYLYVLSGISRSPCNNAQTTEAVSSLILSHTLVEILSGRLLEQYMSLKVVLHTAEFIYQIYNWGSGGKRAFQS